MGRLEPVTSYRQDETLWPRQLWKSLFQLKVAEKVQNGRRALVETTEQEAEKSHVQQHTESRGAELEVGEAVNPQGPGNSDVLPPARLYLPRVP